MARLDGRHKTIHQLGSACHEDCNGGWCEGKVTNCQGRVEGRRIHISDLRKLPGEATRKEYGAIAVDQSGSTAVVPFFQLSLFFQLKLRLHQCFQLGLIRIGDFLGGRGLGVVLPLGDGGHALFLVGRILLGVFVIGLGVVDLRFLAGGADVFGVTFIIERVE